MNRYSRRTTADRMAEAAYYKARSDEAAVANQIPTVSLELCEFDKNRKILKLASEYFGMPRSFFVKSHHTGKEVRFVAIGSEDILSDEDGWDGEMQIYRPTTTVPNVDHMVIYNEW